MESVHRATGAPAMRAINYGEMPVCVDSAPRKRSGGAHCRFTELPVLVPVRGETLTSRLPYPPRAVVRGVRWWVGMVVRFVCVNRVPLCPVCPVTVSRVRDVACRSGPLAPASWPPALPRLPPVRFLNHTVYCYRRARLLHYSLAVAYTTPQFNEYWASASSLTSQEDDATSTSGLDALVTISGAAAASRARTSLWPRLR